MTEVRGRLTEKITGQKLKLEVKRSVRSTIILICGVIVMIAGAAWIISNIASTLVSPSQTVAFAVNNATAVKPGINEARVEGVPAGQITGLKLENGHPVLTVKIKNQYGPIYRNAQAELRPNSALMDMYLDITNPGTKSAGMAQANQPLPVTATQTPVSVDDVLDTFNSPVRNRLSELLSQLGVGLQDHGAQLKTAFEDVVPVLQVAGRISHQLAERAPMTKQLVHNVALLTSTLGQRTTILRSLISNGATAVSALAQSSGNLSATIHELPGTISSVESAFTATSNVLPKVDTAVTSLEPVATDLPKALPAVERLSRQAEPAVRALQTPVTRLRPLAATVTPLSTSLNTIVSKLLPQVPVINRTAQDLVDCKTGVQGFFQWDASMTKFGDARGIVPRGNLVLGGEETGLQSPFEYAPQACAPGQAISGVPPTMANAH